jgi:hypothetical protein
MACQCRGLSGLEKSQSGQPEQVCYLGHLLVESLIHVVLILQNVTGYYLLVRIE